MSELAFWGHLLSGFETMVLWSGVKLVKWMRRVLERVKGRDGEINLSDEVLGSTEEGMEDSVKGVEAWERRNKVGDHN